MKLDRCARVPTASVLLVLLLAAVSARAGGPPVVANVTAQQRPASHLVDITYDMASDVVDSLYVRLYFSADGGASWTQACRSVSGHVGAGVPKGVARQIVWDAGADLPGVDFPASRIRILADEWLPPPRITALHLLTAAETDTLAYSYMDTVPYGVPFGFAWTAHSEAVDVYPPAVLAQLDTVPPLDGIAGFQFGLSWSGCSLANALCWLPRRFDESTGDSIPYFGPGTSLWFANDDSGADIFRARLSSGVHSLNLNARDIDGVEVQPWQRSYPFVVNRDPLTIILDGQADWAHPDDTEIYPYYIELKDPAQAHHPFRSGDRIPDRTYVVAKALAKDDPRDRRNDANRPTRISGYVLGMRQNLTGGMYPFMSQAATMTEQPTWDSGADGWCGDTLGFLTAPRSQFTVNMQGVDEHGRFDGTPAALSFDVGFEPCLQCIELLPKPSIAVSAFDATVPCVEDTSSGYLANHPCLGGVTALRVSAPMAPDPNPACDLESVLGTYYLLVDRVTGAASPSATAATHADSLANYVLPASRYKMAILLQGKDDPRESWSEALRRVGGVQYQVSYACDPSNSIRDGVGNDDIARQTWGQPASGSGLVINATSGVWKLEVDVYVPTLLLTLGEANFKMIIRPWIPEGASDVVELIYNAVTRPFGDGWVDAVILDQTSCAAAPVRPATFNFFRNVRPDMTLAAGQTWRDCILSSPAIGAKLPLSLSAMASLGGTPVRKHFRLTLNPGVGPDIVCVPR